MLKTVPLVALAACLTSLAQAPPPAFRDQSSSTLAIGGPSGEETVEITNVAYEVTSASIPGRPQDQRLVLRKTTRSKRVLDEVGVEATISLDAWPFPSNLTQKPLFSLTVPGTGGHTVDSALFVVSRGLEEVNWWSVYKLGTGEHLFDTYVPLSAFSISREELTQRYVGLEVPPDDVSDARLRQPNVVAVLSYASAERVIRAALITCDNVQRAKLLRSYADTRRTLTVVESPAAATQSSAGPRRALRISFSQFYPSAPASVTLEVPVAGDNLDLAGAHLPPTLHISAWKP